MTVNIDPSEVRSGGTSVKAQAAGRRVPLRALLVGGIGGAALIAFSVGAFSFFSDLADTRVRTVKMAPVASKWPDLKDGVPALAENPASQPATLNLPRPDTAATTTAQAQAVEPPTLRTETSAPSERPAEATAVAAAAPVPAAQTAPVRIVPTEQARAEPPKPEDAKAAAEAAPSAVAAQLPAREEAKGNASQPSTFVSLEPKAATPEPETPAAVTPPAPKPEKSAKAPARTRSEKDKAEKSERAEKKAAEKRQTARKVAAAKPIDETSGAAPAAPGPASDEPDIPGARQIRDGFKALGGLFGKSDGE